MKKRGSPPISNKTKIKTMKAKIKQKINWAKDMIEMHKNEFKIDCKQKHIRRINELNGMIEGLESLL